jgi:DNA polymerase III sliding clamp (beta) subunit (PCNA family)
MATVTTAEFKAAILAINAGIIPKNPLHLVLNCVAISFKKNAVTFTVTDLSVWLEFEIVSCYNFAEENYRSIFVPYTSLVGLVNIITSKTMTLKCCGTDLTIDTDNTTRSVSGMASDFPSIETPEDQYRLGQVNIGRSELNESIAACSKYTCDDATKQILTGINIRVNGKNNTAIAEATDTHFLIESTFPVSSRETFSFVIPSDLPQKLLKQKWKNLTFLAYSDRVIVSDETGYIKFQCQTLIHGKYPQLDRLRNETTANAVVSKIDPQDILSYLHSTKKGYKAVILICENQNFDLYSIDSSTCGNHKSITRDGDGFGWAILYTEQLVQMCTVPKDVKEIAIFLGKASKQNEQLPVIVGYTSKACSFFIGITQVEYAKSTYVYKKKEELVKFYSDLQAGVTVKVESIIDTDDCETIDVDPTEIFGNALDDDESDDD